MLGIFLVETLVRAGLTKGGYLGYLSSCWNAIDLAVIMACSILGVIDMLGILHVYQFSLVVVVHIVSSLRILYLLHRTAIGKEANINRIKEADVRDLQRILDAKVFENIRLEDHLGDFQKRSTKAFNQINSLEDSLLDFQQNTLALSSFSLKDHPTRTNSSSQYILNQHIEH
ncbi:hypothetical protein DSO57_1013114 [Entomophthora muscae]|uniref:Uncharacterized protein n=1 Tax=Entomophthora muscae TaxID=34485 RepID=A0ACC2U4D3_9FUNG|nr:hypothetical protein DSO57_1013114 [Entomophthora muscae]